MPFLSRNDRETRTGLYQARRVAGFGHGLSDAVRLGSLSLADRCAQIEGPRHHVIMQTSRTLNPVCCTLNLTLNTCALIPQAYTASSECCNLMSSIAPNSECLARKLQSV